jgi:hypothetical protein
MSSLYHRILKVVKKLSATPRSFFIGHLASAQPAPLLCLSCEGLHISEWGENFKVKRARRLFKAAIYGIIDSGGRAKEVHNERAGKEEGPGASSPHRR